MTDLIIFNADIITMDANRPDACAVFVKEGKISAIGDTKSVMGFKQSHTHMLDLKGKTLCPGFIDAHMHFRAIAESLIDMDLGPKTGIQSIDDIQAIIHQRVLKSPAGEWIRGVGYNEVYLAEERHPDRWDLDRVSPHHPVKLTHRSGYAHVLNSRGLKKAGITRETSDPEGGIIDRDLKTGDPSGILYGMGHYLSQRIPPVKQEELLRGVALADQRILSYGITSFQDASSRNNRERWHWFEELAAGGTLKPRVTMMLGLEGFKQHQEEAFSARMDPCQLSLGGVKVIIDETTGRLNPSQAELNEIVLSIHEAGQQAVIHAIENSAVEAAIAALENALKIFPRSDHRHRIEHCSLCPPDLSKKIASLGVFVVTHPAFVYYNGDRYLKTIPSEQLKFLYPISSLIKGGVYVAAGSDAPIITADPLSGIYGAVTRSTDTGKTVLADERIAVYDAIRMYTDLAAMSVFEEKIKGTISIEKYADFAVLSANPTRMQKDEIKDIDVEMTIVGGKTVWARDRLCNI